MLILVSLHHAVLMLNVAKSTVKQFAHAYQILWARHQLVVQNVL